MLQYTYDPRAAHRVDGKFVDFGCLVITMHRFLRLNLSPIAALAHSIYLSRDKAGPAEARSALSR